MDLLNHFRDLKELTKTLSDESVLLSQMFENRKHLKFLPSLALELVGGNESRLKRLLDYGVLVEDGSYLLIESNYLDFFEDVLNANEEISVLSVQECINSLKELIGYYLQETNANRRAGYQDSIRLLLKKTSFRTLKNVVSLKREMDVTYKQQPNYRIKIDKLNILDEKSKSLRLMITECEKLMDNEKAFFLMANDPQMTKTCSDVRHSFTDAYYALMEIERQKRLYINQVEQQNKLYRKIGKLKYLLEKHLLRDNTNIESVLESINPLWMEPRPYSKVRLSIEALWQNDHISALLKRIAIESGIKTIARVDAEPLAAEDLEEHVQEMNLINKDEIWNGFSASGHNLFDYILHFNYRSERTLEEHAVLFCQMVIEHPEKCQITDEYAVYQDIEYPIIYAK